MLRETSRITIRMSEGGSTTPSGRPFSERSALKQGFLLQFLRHLHALLQDEAARTISTGAESNLEANESNLVSPARNRMHEDVRKTGSWLGQVLRYWLNYCAVLTSSRSL